MDRPEHGDARGPAGDCWGCGSEPSVGGTLGERCRLQLAELRTDPATPRLNDMIAKLDDVYHRLCWNCEVELSAHLSGLCPRCEDEIRR